MNCAQVFLAGMTGNGNEGGQFQQWCAVGTVGSFEMTVIHVESVHRERERGTKTMQVFISFENHCASMTCNMQPRQSMELWKPCDLGVFFTK